MIHKLNINTDRQIQFKEVTGEVQALINRQEISNGIAIVFVPHTTAAVTINENADPDVATDMINGLNKLIPFEDNYRHLEGNSAAHIKSSLIGTSETLIIENGALILGTWQGLYFCEFDGPRSRHLYVRLIADE